MCCSPVRAAKRAAATGTANIHSITASEPTCLTARYQTTSPATVTSSTE
jgi:hypothetical protein